MSQVLKNKKNLWLKYNSLGGGASNLTLTALLRVTFISSSGKTRKWTLFCNKSRDSYIIFIALGAEALSRISDNVIKSQQLETLEQKPNLCSAGNSEQYQVWDLVQDLVQSPHPGAACSGTVTHGHNCPRLQFSDGGCQKMSWRMAALFQSMEKASLDKRIKVCPEGQTSAVTN